jgi:hypothetical protein
MWPVALQDTIHSTMGQWRRVVETIFKKTEIQYKTDLIINKIHISNVQKGKYFFFPV